MNIIKRSINIFKKYKDDIQAVLAIVAGLLTVGYIGYLNVRHYMLFQIIVSYFVIRELNNYLNKSRLKASKGEEQQHCLRRN